MWISFTFLRITSYLSNQSWESTFLLSRQRGSLVSLTPIMFLCMSLSTVVGFETCSLQSCILWKFLLVASPAGLHPVASMWLVFPQLVWANFFVVRVWGRLIRPPPQKKIASQGAMRGLRNFVWDMNFCELETHATFWNPTTTPSGILVMLWRKNKKKINLPKIVVQISCSAGRMHFAWTKIHMALFMRLILTFSTPIAWK